MKVVAALSGRRILGEVSTRRLIEEGCQALYKAKRPGGCRKDIWIVGGVSSAKGPRPNNEDSAAVALEGPFILVVVADGVGGAESGEVASAVAVCTALRKFAEFTALKGNPVKWLGELFDEAHHAIYSSLGGRGATTLTVALYHSVGQLYVANVGDSPLYVVGPYVELITSNLDEQGQYITQAIGHQTYEKPHIYQKQVMPTAIVAVSDGVDDLFDKQTYKLAVDAYHPSAYKIARALTCGAIRRGARDNATAAVAAFTGMKIISPAKF